MNYEEKTLDELKSYAKSIGITVGNISKEKLISKINEKEKISAVLKDADLDEVTNEESIRKDTVVVKDSSVSLLDSIALAIDDLDDATSENIPEVVDELPIDTIVPVKSLRFGGLTYKSRSTNATYRWNQIGAIQYMTVAELNEMNNFKPSFLNKPLVILMDQRAVKKFRLTPVYENVAKINNLTTVFNSDMKTIEKVIDDALSVDMRDILISKVRQMYKNKKLVDINIIRLLEKKLQFDLSDAE